MYKVFNMGQRLEVYTDEKTAEKLIDLGEQFQIKAQITGKAEKSAGKKITIHTAEGEVLEY
jgi:phosphoribosylformylglycinamidine cyclo-ligase